MENTERRELPILLPRVVEITGYKPSYIYKLVRRNEIPFHKMKEKNGGLRFYESEIFDFINRRRKATSIEISEKADAILNGEAS